MSTSLIDEFEAAATGVGATVTRTTSAQATGVLDDVVERPAVGAPLPYEDVSLPDDVTTDPPPSALEAAATGVTAAGAAVADHGAVVVESTAAGEALASLFPERHLAVVAAGDVVADLRAAMDHVARLAADGRDAVVVTGPSATADMGELVVGAHGPREVGVVVLEDR
jgi:L-lactate dehydrogenase complex protein LldG